MKPANIVTLVTQDALQLNAILFGPPSAEVGLIFVHGLGSSAFSHNDILPSGDTYVSLYIHNRGHDGLTGIRRLDPETEKGYDWAPGGKAHEIFTDCVHDIQAGIDCLKELGTEKIYLVGHSTGCQKSVYFLAQANQQREVNGAILICPMSDYAAARHTEDPEKLAAATAFAQRMVQEGRPADLIPEKLWQETVDAQRFLSLYAADSIEEIFTYSQTDKQPELLQEITEPLLILIAEKDEYADRPTDEIAQWFTQHTKNASVRLIQDSLHGLTGRSEAVKNLISEWLLTQSEAIPAVLHSS